MLKVYMDNCCYHRPFDNQKDNTIRLETQAKIFIQSLIRYKAVQLVYSSVTLQEIADSPFEEKSRSIMEFLEGNAKYFIGRGNEKAMIALTLEIMRTGLKHKDAAHAAYAIIAACDYLITTDKRLLKYADERIRVVNPVNFVQMWEVL